MKPLTKKHIRKLLDTPIDLALWNGTFNRARVKATCNRRTFRVEVDVTHPSLMWNQSSGAQFLVKFIDCDRVYEAVDIPVQKELWDLIYKMINAAKMTDEEARKLSDDLIRLVNDFYTEMGITK